MDIVIIAQYLRDIENFENNNSRFVYIAKMLRDDQHNVEIITSDFHHSSKVHFNFIGDLYGITVTALHELGYSQNVCLKRLISHKELARNLKKYLRQRTKPDLIYVAVPSLDVAEVCANYCDANNVKFIVDIQDLWPEAFRMLFNVPILSNLVFRPMENKANRIYAAADEIVAVSKTYADRGMRVNKKCMTPTVVFLGTEKTIFDQYSKRHVNYCDELKATYTIVYIGTLGHSYDLECIIDAIAKLKIKQTVEFLVMGEGPMKQKFENAAKKKGIAYTFTGLLSYPQMVEKLTECDIAVNPIRKGAAGSIINKIGDYAMAGLPVVNTQECEEYRDLLDKYKSGINCECENSNDVAKAIQYLISNPSLRTEMGRNSRKLGEEKIDRKNSYKNIVRVITSNEDNKW